jgi:hypothetical protein
VLAILYFNGDSALEAGSLALRQLLDEKVINGIVY